MLACLLACGPRVEPCAGRAVDICFTPPPQIFLYLRAEGLPLSNLSCNFSYCIFHLLDLIAIYFKNSENYSWIDWLQVTSCNQKITKCRSLNSYLFILCIAYYVTWPWLDVILCFRFSLQTTRAYQLRAAVKLHILYRWQDRSKLISMTLYTIIIYHYTILYAYYVFLFMLFHITGNRFVYSPLAASIQRIK